MRVFVTGATGFVGSAVVHELLKAGHQVLGLARSESSAAALAKTGAEVHRGDLEDLASLRKGAEMTDGIIHTGFVHDFARFREVCEIDRRAVGAMAEVLVGSNRPLVSTSGTALAAPGRLATERDKPGAESRHPRVLSELAVHAAADRGVKAMLVRLSPSVHGEGDHLGFISMLTKLAREKGSSAYVDDGNNRWTGVHRLDAAVLYRLALEKGTVGAIFHAADEEGIPFREIATLIGKGTGLPVVSKTAEEIQAHFGFVGAFAGLDCPASSALTRQELGWKPTRPGLLADLAAGFYFRG